MGIIRKKIDRELESFVLTNRTDVRVTILNYGATIASIEVPDSKGQIADVVLGHCDLKNYVGGRFYFGGTIGRYANRIARGRFVIDGKEYQVTANRNGDHLHGGAVGFDKKFWQASVDEGQQCPSLEFRLVSPDGEEGFPGTMDVKVIYSLTEDNELQIQYMAISDRPTVINLTNHSYFNLTGSAANSILDHVLMIDADEFTPINSLSFPTGEMVKVDGTPMDFRKPTRIGERIDSDYDQLKFAGGYDHNWVLNDFNGFVRKVATLYEPNSGRLMEVLTDQPGFQFYSGNYLDGSVKGKGNILISKRSGVCLECQHYPDSPNHTEFPSVVLKPGETYKQTTIYKFLAF